MFGFVVIANVVGTLMSWALIGILVGDEGKK
jgi:hypothetical protein